MKILRILVSVSVIFVSIVFPMLAKAQVGPVQENYECERRTRNTFNSDMELLADCTSDEIAATCTNIWWNSEPDVIAGYTRYTGGCTLGGYVQQMRLDWLDITDERMGGVCCGWVGADFEVMFGGTYVPISYQNVLDFCYVPERLPFPTVPGRTNEYDVPVEIHCVRTLPVGTSIEPGLSPQVDLVNGQMIYRDPAIVGDGDRCRSLYPGDGGLDNRWAAICVGASPSNFYVQAIYENDGDPTTDPVFESFSDTEIGEPSEEAIWTSEDGCVQLHNLAEYAPDTVELQLTAECFNPPQAWVVRLNPELTEVLSVYDPFAQ